MFKFKTSSFTMLILLNTRLLTKLYKFNVILFKSQGIVGYIHINKSYSFLKLQKHFNDGKIVMRIRQNKIHNQG